MQIILGAIFAEQLALEESFLTRVLLTGSHYSGESTVEMQKNCLGQGNIILTRSAKRQQSLPFISYVLHFFSIIKKMLLNIFSIF